MPIALESVCFDASSGAPAALLATAMAHRCIMLSEVRRVPLVVHAGVFRDDNLIEPAQAPFLQRELGMVARTEDDAHVGFSFDVNQLLAAFELGIAMIGAGTTPRALVVAADAAVPGGLATVVPSAASAMLVERANEGFIAFRTDTFPEHAELHRAHMTWRPPHTPGGGPEGRNVLEIEQHPSYVERASEAAAKSVLALTADLGARTDGFRRDTLVLASQCPEGFVAALRSKLEMSVECFPEVVLAGVYTAGPLAAMVEAMKDGRWASARRVLFVTVSPGLVASSAWYEKASRGRRGS